MWTGTFRDDGTVAVVGEAALDDTNQPFGVAGEFNAHFTNGHAHGAYGASLVEE